MALLRDGIWKGTYKSGKDNDDFLKDLYIPALNCAVSYKRAVGYFSSELLIKAAEGLSALVRSGGEMKLIIGEPLDEGEYEAVLDGSGLKRYGDDLCENIFSMLSGDFGEDAKYKAQLLTWLTAKGILEIKFAFRSCGMYHDKLGIITDAQGDRIVFTGTANETIYGLDQNKNKESLSVYPSWDVSAFEKWGAEHEKDFERLWNGEESDTFIYDLPSSAYGRIASHFKGSQMPDLDREAYLHELNLNNIRQTSEVMPFIPTHLGGEPFLLKKHQKDALNSWVDNNYNGLFRLATGSGKTITAIFGAVTLYNEWKRIAVVITVPYQELARQWVEVLNIFGISPIECFQERSKWSSKLLTDIQAFNIRSKNFLCVVAVNNTLADPYLQSLIHKISKDEFLFIGDECHRLGSETYYKSLPVASYRMGLSATPFIDDDDELETPFPNESKVRLIKYFGDIVAEYTLENAINDGVLSKYRYHVTKVMLTEEEQIEYERLSAEIAKLLFSNGKESKPGVGLSAKFGERSRLLGSASGKILSLKTLLSQLKIDKKYTIFYCAEGRSEEGIFDKYIDNVSLALREADWKSSKFTAGENTQERRKILEAFSAGNIDALVSMKVLDEGIDIPICKRAFILASTRNPRQYVQRRGRILRKHEDKDYAEIYDFMLCPHKDYENSSASISLLKAEKDRVYDFLELSINKHESFVKLNEAKEYVK